MLKVRQQQKTQTEGLGIKMKKILIIFFGLILGCNLASAKSVSCWDEYTQAYLPGTESKMKTALGNDVNIIKVATKAKAFTHYGSP